MNLKIRVIGAGLAGSEAAWQIARRGLAVELFEMRPVRSTPAHQTGELRRIGLLKFPEIRHGKHRAMAAQGRNAASRIAADEDCSRMRGSRWPCTGRGSYNVCRTSY